MFYGAYIFKFFGTIVFLLYYLIKHYLTQSKKKTFSEIWKGPNYSDLADGLSYEIFLKVTGIIFIMVVVSVILSYE